MDEYPVLSGDSAEDFQKIPVCDECDDRGMITEHKNGGVYGHSHNCAKYSFLVKRDLARLEGVGIAGLVNYLDARHAYKMRNHD